MPRRRTAAGKHAADTQAASSSEFTCPECGKTFSRAASLGAHRNRAHGVAGASKRRTRSTVASPAASGRTRRRPGAGRASAQATTPASRRRAGAATVDRDQLLQALFPNGIPAREEVIRRANTWLDEAEKLANMN